MATVDGPSIGIKTVITKNIDEAYAKTLQEILDTGQQVDTHKKGDDSNVRSSKEIWDFHFCITNPLDRILYNPVRSFNIIEAVARFVWMLAGSDRVKDMAFYQPKVKKFTDDGISVPGSNYGMRIFQPRPNLNQIEGNVNTLKNEIGSRRAATVIWSPEDAVRNSGDIPCAFGTFYANRNCGVIATTLMRSNNAFLLLPYNIFEFSMIGEMVAREIGVDYSLYTHTAISMHVFNDQIERSKQVIDTYEKSLQNNKRIPMRSMPSNPSPLEQGRKLAQLEASLRNDHVMSNIPDLNKLIEKAVQELDPYWLDFYKVLVIHSLINVEKYDEAKQITNDLPVYFQHSLLDRINFLKTSTMVRQPPKRHTLDTFIQSQTARVAPHLESVKQSFASTGKEEEETRELIYGYSIDWEKQHNERLSISEYESLIKRLIRDRPTVIAARSEGPEKDSKDMKKLSKTEVWQEIEQIKEEG